MKVHELIEFLKTQPQEIEVAYSLFSESCLLVVEDISVVEAGEPRPDGWVADKRPDKPTRQYLMFPGN